MPASIRFAKQRDWFRYPVSAVEAAVANLMISGCHCTTPVVLAAGTRTLGSLIHDCGTPGTG